MLIALPRLNLVTFIMEWSSSTQALFEISFFRPNIERSLLGGFVYCFICCVTKFGRECGKMTPDTELWIVNYQDFTLIIAN